jgi:hypothetical protein
LSVLCYFGPAGRCKSVYTIILCVYITTSITPTFQRGRRPEEHTIY